MTGPGPSSSRPPSRANSRSNITQQSAFARLSAGLPARTNSVGASAHETVTPASPALAKSKSSSDIKQPDSLALAAKLPINHTSAEASCSVETKAKLDAPSRVGLEDLDMVQGICQSENEPLRHDIRSLQAQLAGAQPTVGLDLQRQLDELKLDQLKFQQQQESQFEKLTNQLPSAEELAALARDIRVVRQDHNSLMERSSRVQAQPVEDHNSTVNATVEERDQQIRELQRQLALAQAGAVAKAEEPRDLSPLRDRSRNARRDRSPHSEETQYSSDDDPAYYGSAYRSDAEDPTKKIRFFARDKGPAYLTLRAERPSDPTFDRLMNYRYYRLLKRRATRDADAMIDGQRRIKALQRSLEAQAKFDGKDPILVFPFLTRFTEEADLNGLTEAQALVALPRFLTGDASLSFQTAQSSGHAGGVNSWPEAVHHLLTTYATPGSIREAVLRVQEMKQKASEDELSYNARLSQAIYRCGNVYSESQKITFFVNGLLPDIRSRVARHRESIPRHAVRYNMIVQYARDEGETVRAQHASVRQMPRRQATPSRETPVNLLESGSGRPPSNNDAQDLFLLQNGQAALTEPQPVSDNTSDLPSTCDMAGQSDHAHDHLFMVQAPHVPHGDKQLERNRPGWKAKPPLVCHTCFVKNKHISPDCNANPFDFALIVRNYEALTPSERSLVPSSAYYLAKRCLEAGASPASNNNPNPNSPKN